MKSNASFLSVLSLLLLTLLLLGLCVGSNGWAWPQDSVVLMQIRLPRTLGALLVGMLLGLAGAVAQGLLRNPLADPYLLGSASGASLAVVLVLASASGLAELASWQWLAQLGLVSAAFIGALVGVALTLLLARGAQHTMQLLLVGVVVGVLLGALTDVITTISPQALRGKHLFMLGNTGYLGWDSVVMLASGLVVTMPLALRYARGLDALTLGEDSAASLGLHLPRLRWILITLLALCTGLAVSQAGLVAFIGLIAPHVVRRCAPGAARGILLASAVMGGVLLLAADVLARGLIAPEELPVGVVTAVLGGGYLLFLLRKGVR